MRSVDASRIPRDGRGNRSRARRQLGFGIWLDGKIRLRRGARFRTGRGYGDGAWIDARAGGLSRSVCDAGAHIWWERVWVGLVASAELRAQKSAFSVH